MSEALLQEAHRLLRAGLLDSARAKFVQLQADPVWAADALNGLGLCAEALGELEQAEVFYTDALGLRPDEPEYLNNLAICRLGLGQVEAGLACFRQLVQLRPDSETLYNLALTLATIGQPWEAIEVIRQLLDRHPATENAVLFLIELVRQLGQGQPVLIRLQQLQAAVPAEPAYQLALAAWYNAGSHSEMAVKYFRAALRCNPALLGVYRPLIRELQSRGQFNRALEKARHLFTSEASLESLVQMVNALQVPVPASEEQVRALRQELEMLLELFVQPENTASLCKRHEVYRPATLPFYLAYQWGEDRPMQEKLAVFFAGFLQNRRLSWQPNPRPRLGIFSVHLYKHSVTDFVLRAVETLLASGSFETWIFYYTVDSNKQDQVTRDLEAKADHFVPMPASFQEGAQLIAEANLDLLIYLDVGMDSYAYALALNPLARYQLVLPGHPVTSGMASLDYFLSGQALEPPQADAFYTETLIRLPGLPDYPRPVIPPAASRLQLGLPQGNLYFCPMSLFKIQPAFDAVLAEILRADPEARVLLLENKHQLHWDLQARFHRSFPAEAGRLQFLPWSNQETFFQRLQTVDVILDTFPFGGGNTSYQALGLGCPIVCLDVPWMKGRWTQAMYQLMGMTGLVAPTPEAYAELSVRIATDKAWQAELRQQILAKNTVLFDNPTWSQALLEFCRQLVSHE